MSTAGSRPDGHAGGSAGTSAPPVPDQGAYTPRLEPGPTPPALPRRKRPRIVRWQGLIPLALILALLAIGYVLFGERIARHTLEDAATDALGTEVDIASLHILEGQTAVELRKLEIADPFDTRRNLIEVGRLFLAVEPVPALEKHLIVRTLTIDGVRVGTKRDRPARPVSGKGFAPQALLAVKKWRQNLDVPLLRLAPIDSVKAVLVDPSRLSAVRAALGVRDRADSVQHALRDAWGGLRLEPTYDSTRAMAARLQSAANDPRALGLTGAKQLVADLRRTIGGIDSAKRRVDALQQGVRDGAGLLDANVRALDDSARVDYQRARAMLQLPTVGAPDLGAAFFGKVTIDQLQQLVYWTALAERYVPPGLRPRPEPGPRRLRAAGTTVAFVAPEELPRFWLRRGSLQLRLDDGPARGDYRLSMADVTTDPAIVGRPTIAVLNRVAAGGVGVRAVALIDRRGTRPRDSVAVQLSAIPLPAFDIPGTPFRLDPGAGRSSISLLREGDRLAGGWALRSSSIRWLPDSARLARANVVEQLVYRVITGLNDVDVQALVSGTTAAPRVAVRSNLDRAVADRLRVVVGEEVAKAEARLRAEVDKQIAERTAPVRQRVAEVRAEAEQRVADARARLDEERKKLEEQRKLVDERVRKATGGLVGLPGV